MTNANIEKSNVLLDVLKFICAILIVGSHLLPIFHNETLNLYYGQFFFRFCVPLFIISSGFYFERMQTEKKWKYVKRIFLIYIIATILYSPFIIWNNRTEILNIFATILFGYCHLWYLIAVALALLISYMLNKILPAEKHKGIYGIACIVLLVFGIFFDEYYKLFNNSFLNNIATILKWFGGTRNFIFMTFPILTIGRFIFLYRDKIFLVRPYVYIILTILSFILAALELTMLNSFNINNLSLDISVFNFMPAIFLFVLTFYWNPKILHKRTTKLRKQADIIYIVHILVSGILDMILPIKLFTRFIVVLLISWALSAVYINVMNIVKRKNNKMNS